MIVLALAVLITAAEPQRPPGAGVFSVWLDEGRRAKVEELVPYLHGGQAVADWSEVERTEGKFDFSRIDAMVAAQASRRRFCTIQVNASDHPDYLYARVPVIGKFVAGPLRANPRGHLQYWHPDYVNALQRMIHAFGAHYKASPHRAWILGVRLNWNALSTEHTDVPAEFRDPSSWQSPKGAKPHPEPYSAKARDDYQQKILAAYIEAFSPDIRILCRNNAVFGERLGPAIAAEIEKGRMGLFHTSSEVEPRGIGGEKQYQAFLKYCRNGQTICYAEPWADAEGRHGGGKKDARWCSPAQWNYWTQLANLHCGVSYIAEYGADLIRANEPEFKAAFDLVDRYAGYHASPSTSPGAWIAFREGSFLKGDYTFLMERISGGTPVANVGPPEQRFGAWARRLAPGESMKLQLDRTFAASLAGKAAAIRVIYLDEPGASLKFIEGGRTHDLPMSGAGRWITQTILVEGVSGEIRISAPAGGALHWVEVVRTPTSSSAAGLP